MGECEKITAKCSGGKSVIACAATGGTTESARATTKQASKPADSQAFATTRRHICMYVCIGVAGHAGSEKDTRMCVCLRNSAQGNI